MTEENLARVVVESPVHGPIVVAEIERLRALILATPDLAVQKFYLDRITSNVASTRTGLWTLVESTTVCGFDPLARAIERYRELMLVIIADVEKLRGR